MKEAAPTFRCWAEIDLSALRRNAAALRARAAKPIRLMAIVKANAYGHGLARVVRALSDQVEMFGVANVREACAVQADLPKASIFILGPALPHERAEIAAHRFIPAISDLQEARAYDALCCRDTPLSVHVAIDTGMGRMGVWQEDALDMIRAMRDLRGIEITGVATHLPVADEDDAFTAAQLDRFHEIVGELRRHGLKNTANHAANSAGLIAFSAGVGDMVRAGLALYGSAPRPEFQADLCPVMTWKTRISLVRDLGPGRSISYGRTFITPTAMRVATLGVGYADGYPRQLSNRGADVLIEGRRCSVLGRVTMDQIMVDVSAVPEAASGDEVVLIGRQRAEEISALELARKAGTIAWDVFTGIGPRVERLYV